MAMQLLVTCCCCRAAGYVFRWYAEQSGVVTLNTCEYTSADTVITVYSDGQSPIMTVNATCLRVGSNNG